MSTGRVVRRSFTRPGRIVPADARRLRGRSVILKAREIMDWHSTGVREELLIVLAGRLRLEHEAASGRLLTTALKAGQCAFIPRDVRHRVVNRSTRASHYLYLTASARG